MRKLTMALTILATLSSTAFAGNAPRPCREMDEAASALAKVNGGTFASPSYRIAQTPVLTEQGEEYGYQFDVMYSQGDELPNKIIGTIKTKALRKTGEQKCKVLEMTYSE